ncbi:MAG: DnaA/Hda family protein [Planctomycetaceae bacterium]|nr:DnaA/Hda family protein [Planctomycetaceae bacterium]
MMVVSGLESEPLLLVPEIRLAHTAVKQLASQDSSRPSIVFISGPPGSGKSHLARLFLQGLGTRKQGVTASQFAAELAEASERRNVPGFQENYRSLDVLVCEDLQALAGRRQSQVQLLAVIDDMIVRRGRVLVSASKLPGRLERCDPKLISRLRGGVVVSIRNPGPASRLQLLEHLASRHQIPLPVEVAQLLARRISGSARDLIAALGQLETLARISGGVIDLPLARQVLAGDAVVEPPTLAAITRDVARQFGISPRQLRQRSRAQHIVTPRQCAMFLTRELTGAIYSKIAAYFGCSNHTTVLHACRRMQQRLSEEPELRQAVHAIHARLTGHEESGG